MTKREISKTPTGSVYAYKETPQERADRIERAASRALDQIRLTPGQRRVLERVQARAGEQVQTA